MSDSVTIGQQRREEQNAMALNSDSSPVSEELIRTGQGMRDNRGELASPQTAGFWPNSNQTKVDVTPCVLGAREHPSMTTVPLAKTPMP